MTESNGTKLVEIVKGTVTRKSKTGIQINGDEAWYNLTRFTQNAGYFEGIRPNETVALEVKPTSNGMGYFIQKIVLLNGSNKTPTESLQEDISKSTDVSRPHVDPIEAYIRRDTVAFTLSSPVVSEMLKNPANWGEAFSVVEAVESYLRSKTEDTFSVTLQKSLTQSIKDREFCNNASN